MGKPRPSEEEIERIRAARASKRVAEKNFCAVEAAGFGGLKYEFSGGLALTVQEDWQGSSGADTIAGLQWAGGIRLARYFDDPKCFPEGFWRDKTVIELGAGCALTSCVLAGLGALVYCTDADMMHARISVEANEAAMRLRAGEHYKPPVCAEFCWGTTHDPPSSSFDVIVCGDCLYCEEHARLLCEALEACAAVETEVYLCGAVGVAAHEAFVRLVPRSFEVEELIDAECEAKHRGPRVDMWGSRAMLRLFRRRPPPLSAVKPATKKAITAQEARERFFFSQEAETANNIVDATPPDLAEALAKEIAKLGALSESKISRNGVCVIDGALTDEECDRIVQALGASPERSFWSSSDTDDARSFRDAETLEAAMPDLARVLWERTRPVLFEEDLTIFQVDEDPIDGGLWEASGWNEDFLLATYPSNGGGFAPHSDGATHKSFNERSFFSCILYLNTPAKGGETRFYAPQALKSLLKKEDKRWTADCSFSLGDVEPRKGRLLVFDQRLVHEGLPVPTDCKHIIRSDILFTRRPARLDSADDREAYVLYSEAVDLAGEGRHDDARRIFEKCRRVSPALAAAFGL